MNLSGFETISHRARVCVVGGGLSGLCAALACARHGVDVLLMHDRPVLGGNASSEIRMWICGAHGKNNRETGLIEELLLENQYLNPEKNYSLWDSVLYGAAREQERLTLLLNCACLDGRMEGGALREITGYQTTTQQFHRVEADLFIDCSGDSVLQPLTGAAFRQGREGRAEYGESIAPPNADRKTMGMSCLMQARQETAESVFIPPSWARPFTREALAPYRLPDMNQPGENFWYLELGGENDAIHDTESLRDELLAQALGLWDYVKNAPENREKNKCWHLDWLGFLPGKRESRRYVGAYTMTQHDVERGGRFDDVVAYGGWTMDDHHPAGLRTQEPPTIYHPAPSPFGIPFRSLYARDVPNLLFAGRNISVTHAALSASRVMATCALLGQAAGTAAALAAGLHCLPRDLAARHIALVQQQLMEDDCYLPGLRRQVSPLSLLASYRAGASDASVLRNGLDRPIGEADNGLTLALDTALEMRFESPQAVSGLRLIFDSDLNRDTLPETARGLYRPMLCNRPLNWPVSCVPRTLVRSFEIQLLSGGAWRTVYTQAENHQRLCRAVFASTPAQAIRLIPRSTWGSEAAHLYAVDIL